LRLLAKCFDEEQTTLLEERKRLVHEMKQSLEDKPLKMLKEIMA
jgi:hypothetical protein